MKNRGNIKVAIVTGSLGMGGAELITLNLSSGLKQVGYQVTVVTVTEPGEWFPLLRERGIEGIHIARRDKVHPYGHAWCIGKRLRDEGFKVVILVKYTNSERCTQAALNMLPDDVVVIPWIHSDTPECYKTALTNSGAWNVAVAVGDKITKSASRKYPNKKIVHIPNGFDFSPIEKVNEKRQDDSGIFQICYLGRLHQYPKNIFALPDILEQCKIKKLDLILHVVGDGPDRKELENRFNGLSLSGNIVFHGALPNHDVFQILNQSHALLLPSFTEAMPCAPIEAQFCGCVPVASRLPGVTDTIIEDNKTGILVEVQNVSSFSQAIIALAADREQWSKMSRAGMQLAKHYSIEAMSNGFNELIQASLRGEYPLERPRRKWLPINPFAMTLREAVPRQIHRLGIGNYMRKLLRKKNTVTG